MFSWLSVCQTSTWGNNPESLTSQPRQIFTIGYFILFTFHHIVIPCEHSRKNVDHIISSNILTRIFFVWTSFSVCIGLISIPLLIIAKRLTQVIPNYDVTLEFISMVCLTSVISWIIKDFRGENCGKLLTNVCSLGLFKQDMVTWIVSVFDIMICHNNFS